VTDDSAGAIESEAGGAEPGPDKVLDLAPLPGLIGYALRRAQVAFFQRFRQIFADLDLTPSQLGVLTVVANNPGLKQSEVSAALGIKRANLVPLLDALAARDLLARTRLAADRRSHALHLTKAGAALLARAQAREAEHERVVAALLGPGGRDSLIDLLGRVETACRAGEAEEG
jgi:DNA-binding MarR family transcriptional regulator